MTTKQELSRSNDTKYKDLTGRVTMDFHNAGIGFQKFAKQHGIDIDKYTALSLSFGAGESIGVAINYPATIYCVEKANGATYDEITSCSFVNEKTELTEFKINLSIESLLAHLKRFHFVATTSILDNCHDTIEITPAP